MTLRCAGFLLTCASLTVADSANYTYWIAPCEDARSQCQPGDPQLATWAMAAWQNAAPGALRLEPAKNREHARIRLYWATSEQGLYGEARPILVDGKRGAEVYVRPAPFDTQADQLLRETIVYLTCLHETGHALGLPHTADFADIMYSFQYGGDIPEYFARYRRKLTKREDIRKNDGLSDADKARLKESVFIRVNPLPKN
ncbi:MAG TPA: matrixin family metalloprotease [Bryobacteraceae bacterium]|nr:matrixin family metalloprotease [Bryobacteraceae bacterium]